MRKWFSSEFTWRLYVILQVVSLIVAGLIVLALLKEDRLPYKLKHQRIYEEVETDPVRFAEAWAKCEELKKPGEPPLSELEQLTELVRGDLSPRYRCLIDLKDSRKRVVGKKYAGFDIEGAYLVVLTLLVLPFVVVRVPTWLWEGWRKDRRKPVDPQRPDE